MALNVYDEDNIDLVTKNFAKTYSLTKAQQSKLCSLINNEIEKINHQANFLNDMND